MIDFLTRGMVYAGSLLIDCGGKRARLLKRDDYQHYDLFVCMDDMNISDMKHIFGGDPDGKIKKLLDYTDHPGNVADPWYTNDFERTYRDILKGCEALYQHLA